MKILTLCVKYYFIIIILSFLNIIANAQTGYPLAARLINDVKYKDYKEGVKIAESKSNEGKSIGFYAARGVLYYEIFNNSLDSICNLDTALVKSINSFLKVLTNEINSQFEFSLKTQLSSSNKEQIIFKIDKNIKAKNEQEKFDYIISKIFPIIEAQLKNKGDKYKEINEFIGDVIEKYTFQENKK